MRCYGTCQGNNHCLRPAPSLAGFDAATRLTTLRQQSLSTFQAMRGHGGITARVLHGGIIRLYDDVRVEPLFNPRLE